MSRKEVEVTLKTRGSALVCDICTATVELHRDSTFTQVDTNGAGGVPVTRHYCPKCWISPESARKALAWAQRYVRGVRAQMPAGTSFHEDYLLDEIRSLIGEGQ